LLSGVVGNVKSGAMLPAGISDPLSGRSIISNSTLRTLSPKKPLQMLGHSQGFTRKNSTLEPATGIERA
jgi:hypothetical protein